MSDRAQIVIEVNHVPPAERWAPVLALDDVSLEVRGREFVALSGLRLRQVDTALSDRRLSSDREGHDLIEGKPVSARPRHRVSAFRCFPGRACAPTSYGLERMGLPREKRETGTDLHRPRRAERFEDSYPSALGRHEAAHRIARTLAFDPKILLMDEPFGARRAPAASAGGAARHLAAHARP